MKLEVGKIYVTRSGGKIRIHQIDGVGDYAGKEIINNKENIVNVWYKADGKKYPGTEVNGPNDIVDEWIVVEAKPKHIDQVTLIDYQRGFAKLWDMGRKY